ncbi:MAG: hypothetical protein U5N55_00585 [Cypionkella sp.]|nr:hypothetical protein [Cypionkella sp.]
MVSGTFSGIAHMLRGEISTCNLLQFCLDHGAGRQHGFVPVTMLAMVFGVGILNLFAHSRFGRRPFYAYEAITGAQLRILKI